MSTTWAHAWSTCLRACQCTGSEQRQTFGGGIPRSPNPVASRSKGTRGCAPARARAKVHARARPRTCTPTSCRHLETPPPQARAHVLPAFHDGMHRSQPSIDMSVQMPLTCTTIDMRDMVTDMRDMVTDMRGRA